MKKIFDTLVPGAVLTAENIRELREYQGILGMLAKESECRGFARAFTDDDEQDFLFDFASHCSGETNFDLSSTLSETATQGDLAGFQEENIVNLDAGADDSQNKPVIEEFDFFDRLNDFGY